MPGHCVRGAGGRPFPPRRRSILSDLGGTGPKPGWIGIACAFEVLSVLAYVPAFRAVFCTRMSWATSYKIGVAEEGAGSLFPLGGAGSLALGVWALRRGFHPGALITGAI